MTLLPTLAGDVTVNGLTLNTVDTDGTAWWFTNLDGWWGIPDVDVPEEDRPAPIDGAYDLEGRYKPRVVTLTGGFRPVSPLMAVTSRRRLNDAIRLVHQSGLLVVQEDIPKQATVKLSGKPNIAVSDPAGTTVFEIALKAPDPRKFATQQTDVAVSIPIVDTLSGITPPLTPPLQLPLSRSAVDAIVTNIGNYTTDMTITFYGGVQNPTLINNSTGEFMEFDLTINDGDTLTVDTDSHSALINEQENRNYAITSDSTWFKLLPGDTALEFQAFSASPAAWARVQFRSAWID